MGRGLTRWLAAGAAITGSRHSREGLGGQDRVVVRRANDVTAIVLCDGAGSARHAELGAEIATSAAAEWLVENPDRSLRGGDTGGLLERVVERIDARAIEMSARRDDFACTMLLACTDGLAYACGQIGDGLVGIQQDGTWRPFGPPMRGEHANETVFVTSEAARSLFRWQSGALCDRTGFVVLSDGSAETLHERATNRFAPAVGTIGSWLERATEARVSEALARSLSTLAAERTPDDCSIAMLRRVELDSGDIALRPPEYQRAFLQCATPRSVPTRLRVLAAVEGAEAMPRIADLAHATDLSPRTVRLHLDALALRTAAPRRHGGPRLRTARFINFGPRTAVGAARGRRAA